MTPKLSVIIRTIGRPSLRRAIESVERQNRADVEIVVVAAKPGLVAPDSTVCAVHWIPTEVPLHRCVAANIGLEAARGEYLIFLDDDDWFESGHLDKLSAALDNAPEAVLAHTGVRMESEAGEHLADMEDSPFEPWQLMAMNHFPIHAALFRRSAVEAGQCRFDMRFDVYEDWDFWLQLQKLGPFVHVPGVSAVYLHSATASGVHSLSYGDEPYRRIWKKWGALCDPSWLASVFEHVTQSDAGLADARHQLDAKRVEVEHLTSEVGRLTSEVGHLTSELAAARDREQSLKTQLETITRDLHTVLNSRSWKLTAGLRRLARYVRRVKRRVLDSPHRPRWTETIFPDRYTQWIEQHDTVTAERRQDMSAEIAGWQACGIISVVMPVYDPPISLLREAIDSILAQIYPHWELCIADDASTNPKVRETLAEYAQGDARIRVVYRPQNGHIVEASNSALALATGEFVALMDQDDLLPAHVLFEVAKAICNHPDAGVIYSDEDKISESGVRFDPYFKPDYNYELLLGQNMVNHLGAYRRTLVQEAGGFKVGMEGSQDHDLVLRCIERITPAQVIHIPKVLYHWRVHASSTAASVDSKPYALTAGIRAVNEHLARTCPGATAELHPEVNFYRVRFPLPDPAPKVSIIIPTRNAYPLLRLCLSTLFEKTRYPNFEVVVVDNGSDDPAVLDYLEGLRQAGKIVVLRDDGPFNFSALNNRAVARCTGEYVLLLNNDIEIIEPDWLTEMVSVAARPGVGAVGARLWYPNKTLQHAGAIVGVGGVAGHAHKRLAAGKEGYFGRAVLLQSFTAVTAACLLVKRSIFNAVGGLDEKNLTIAFNDIDFCLKIAQAGYRNVWTPHAQMIHHESATRGSDLAPEKAARFQAEVLFMQRKWGERLLNDPAFNINLSLDDENFILGDAPRDEAAR
jgi:glycosyltransferase involved in cell wall biosynthesis